MERPFLFRFMQKCCSPGRVEEEEDFYYDESRDMICCVSKQNNLPAIELSGQQGPKTKKRDIEKGDDNKDRRMWQ